MSVSDFEYKLPTHLIAQEPLSQRDNCRLLVCDRKAQRIDHRNFRNILHYLRSGDVIVLNETRVIPARLYGRLENGRQIELFLIHETEESRWLVLLRPALKAKIGKTIFFDGVPLTADVIAYAGRGERIVQFKHQGDFWQLLESIGNVPLPPYIRRKPTKLDTTDYQTVYARKPGAVAAPTAGLHFSQDLLQEIKNMGVEIVNVVLHVGIGTFRPVIVDDPAHHKMGAEWYEISENTTTAINRAKKESRRVIAVGTTVVRTLESVAKADGQIVTKSGWTDIFIYPPYLFKCVNGLITNFHLPKSTLLMLVAAFAGREFILDAYQQAIEQQYRFYSYGDAMLLL